MPPLPPMDALGLANGAMPDGVPAFDDQMQIPEFPEDLSYLFEQMPPQGEGAYELQPDGSMRAVQPEDDMMPAGGSPEHMSNLAESLPDDWMARQANELLTLIDDDIESREPWRARFARGMELMGLIPDEVDDGPFPGASTAVMPVLSEAVVQFWARSMAEQVPSEGPAKGKVLGKQSKQQLDRAERIADYVNHELMFLDRSWSNEHSRLLFALPLEGSSFKKTFRDEQLGHNCSVYVRSEDFIANYHFTDLESAPRFTHRIWRTENEVKKAQLSGMYRQVELSPPEIEDLPDGTEVRLEAADFDTESNSRGDDRYELFEVYTELVLPQGYEDDASGIALPYVITIEKHSQKILAIYRGWKEADPLKRRQHPFTKYDYLPGLGFYGLGLLHMIGGLQEAATGALRSIIDGAATASLQGGFITRNASLRDQTLIVEPGVYKQIDATIDELSGAFFTPPFKEPSPVLFQIMGFIVERAEKFAATTEMQTGSENAKNMPVGSTAQMIEQGSKVFSTIHRQLHKALSEELRKRVELIQAYLPVEGYPYDVEGEHVELMAADFAPGISIVPVSDPNIFSSAQRVALAQSVYDIATQNPDIINREKAIRRVFEALNIPDADELFTTTEPPPPMDPVSEVQSLLRGEPVQAYPDQDHMAHILHLHAFVTNPQYGAHPEVLKNIQPAVLALIGQHMAYAWAAHSRALGVPAELLPPPKQGPEEEGQGQHQMPDGSMMPGAEHGMQPMQGEVLPPQGPGVPPEQIAQLAAQVAPQLAVVPGLPSMESQQDQMASEGEQAKLQIEQQRAEMDGQKAQVEAQVMQQEAGLKQRELALKEQQMQIDMQIKQAAEQRAAQEAEIKKQIMIEEAQRKAEADALKQQQEFAKAQEEAQVRAIQMQREMERVEEERRQAQAQEAAMMEQIALDLKAKQAAAAQAESSARVSLTQDNQLAMLSTIVGELRDAMSAPKRVVRDPVTGKAIGVESVRVSSGGSESGAKPRRKTRD